MIAQKGANCANTAVPCLKNYVTSTPATISEAGLCNAMAATSSSTPAQIIARVAAACGISPKTILIMIQKESGLVATNAPTPSMYQTTTGFACPDTAPCNTQYYGFFNQVYRMARQFQYYTDNPTRYGYQKGRNNTILYNPNTACGSSSVYIQNQATANLYIYTPYQPNQAALNNLYGAGDNCSAYGNRNFWRLYNDWFGPTRGGYPAKGAFDAVRPAGENGAHLSGWAFDPDTPTTSSHVAVYRNGAILSWYLAAKPRADVNAAYGISGNHGFEIDLTREPPGTNQYCVFAISDRSVESNPLLGCRTLTIVGARSPVGTIDEVSSYGKTVSIAGWTFDPNAPTQRLYVAPFRSGAALDWKPTDVLRSDVNSVYGLTGSHGFNAAFPDQPPGSQTYCVYSIDGSGEATNPLLGCRSIDIPSRAPFGHLDVATSGKAGIVRLAGWAVDPDVPRTDIPVALYRDGVGVSWYPTNVYRQDVISAFGLGGGKHGFELNLTGQPSGVHQYCLFAIADASYEGNPLFACTTVTVV